MRALRRLRALLLSLVLAHAIPAHAGIDLSLVAAGIPNLVDIEHAGDSRLFLVDQQGRILVLEGTIVRTTPFLDISDLVLFSGEQGLLGLAFHRNYQSNGYFYLNYVNNAGDTVIARYRVSAGNPNVADPGSASILLTEDQPFSNHKGGQLRFGPDGFLYIALGDGGSGGDPQNNGQRLDTLLGKLLRIDVDSATPYAIPAGNPFAGTPGARPEIWAYGLRNPWRFSFDRLTGDIFIADVGQGSWEEIDFEPAATGGRNYGWRRMEGTHCYNPGSNCTDGSLVLPIVEYPHSLGCSVTGGFRYRGTALPEHQGTYFFGDYCTGRIWGATPNSDGSWSATQLLDSQASIATFGEDASGNLYLSHYGNPGQLYRIVPSTSSVPRLTIIRSGAGVALITSTPQAIYCRTICAMEATNGPIITLHVTPEQGTTFVGWFGDPDCSDGVVSLTRNLTCIAQFAAGFTDDPIVNGITPIRAVHITELRARIDALRTSLMLGSYPWTDPTLSIGHSLVRVVHILELRTAVREAYLAAQRSPPSYTDHSLVAGMAVRAVHLAELRTAVVTLE
jgi:glucose/arabinose dehydrogenase